MHEVELKVKIRRMLAEKDGILLAHYYQRPEVQEIADFVGDSLALSIQAARTKAKIIVFAGVHFMAESAAILSPEKTVVLPRIDAGCPLADMATSEDLERARLEYPDAVFVAYVNSTAAVKAKSDICCTSANILKVVSSLEDVRKVVILPDGNLARYCARFFPEKNIIPWPGYCPVHKRLRVEDVIKVRKMYPRAVFAAHPECDSEVLDLADFIGSTAGIISFAGETEKREIIVGTECGIFTELRKRYPEKVFISPLEDFICPEMKYTTLWDVYRALNEVSPVISISEEIAEKARWALDRMLSVR
ncbi:MAG: quinolinate synthase NadA [Syntrophales bacterium]|nr:quinolinate synthase NadA [Syntrophales bacterium]